MHIWDQKLWLLFCSPAHFPLPCPPVPQEALQFIRSSHHPILVLEGTSPGTMTLPEFFSVFLQFCLWTDHIAAHLEGEGANSMGGAVCWRWLCLLFLQVSILDPAGVGGDSRWVLAWSWSGIETPASTQPPQLQVEERWVRNGLFDRCLLLRRSFPVP